MNPSTDTLLSVLKNRAEQSPDHKVFSWMNKKAKEVDSLTFLKLWRKAGAVAVLLESRGIKKGERVMIAYPFGLDFLAGLFGCMRAGVIACSAYPPNPKKLGVDLPKLFRSAEDAGAKFVLTNELLRTALRLSLLFLRTNKLKWIATDQLKEGGCPKLVEVKPEDIAFIQYTSGSTGDPKGVMISHRSLVGNCREMGRPILKSVGMDLDPYGPPSGACAVSWVPQYHDMGLIGAFMVGIYCGGHLRAFSPVDFIKNPLLWHDLIVKHQINITVAPNFAYSLLLKRLEQKSTRGWSSASLEDGDWSHVTFAGFGAEPIDPNVVEKVTSFLKVPRTSIKPAYGMAEVGLLVTFGSSNVYDGLVSCGSATDDTTALRIVSEAGVVAGENEIGEIWIQSPLVASGYWGKPDLNLKTFRNKLEGEKGDWLASGDLGKVVNGELLITGRKKEVIIINGRNFFPVDIERTVEAAFPNVIRPGCVVAFQNSETGIGLVAEVRKGTQEKEVPATLELQKPVGTNHGVRVDYICILKHHSIPKTTSGKLKRLMAKEMCVGAQWPEQEVFSLWNASQPTFSPVVQHADSIDKKSQCSVHIDVDSKEEDLFDDIIATYVSVGQVSNKTWDELGLSSMVSVELRDVICDNFRVSLAADCFERYPTPAALKLHIIENKGTPLPVELPSLPLLRSKNVSWLVMASLQACGAAVLLLIFASSIIPAWYVGNYIAGNDSLAKMFTVGGEWVRWVWVPFVVPTWMLSFTVNVVLLKWCVIWRYHPCELHTPSVAYMRWWFVDRAMDLWERWVGSYIRDTPLIWLFYVLMGTKIHPSVQLDAFIREFDLVEISRGASLEHSVRCCKFSAWDQGQEGPTIRFRPIVIAKECTVKGMICPGVCVGEGALVQRLSVVSEGAYVTAGCTAVGNPAFAAGPAPQSREESKWFKIGILKVLWLAAELYIFFAILLIGQMFLNNRLPDDWRYTPLFYWVLLMAQYSVLSVGSSIAIKWILIGRRQPGPYKDSMWRTFKDWAADYHFRISIVLLYDVSYNSRLWNLILKLCGMDIDFESNVFPEHFTPSKVDLIAIKKSSVSAVTFDTKRDSTYHRTEISESSLALWVSIGPGVKVSRAVISPMTYLTENVIKEYPDKRNAPKHPLALVCHEAATSVYYLVLLAMIFASFIPSYDLWMAWLKPPSVWFAVPVLALALAMQTLSWVILLNLLQLAIFIGSTAWDSPWSPALYVVYHSATWAVQRWSLLSVLWGSPIFSRVARVLGTTVKGRFLFFGSSIYEFPYVHVEDRTVIDRAIVTGHYAVFGRVALGPCKVSGILHEGTFAMANAVVSTKETGPWRNPVTTDEKVVQQEDTIHNNQNGAVELDGYKFTDVEAGNSQTVEKT